MAISLRLPAEIEARLDRLAELTGRSKTYYAIEAISRHLDDLEDLYVAEHRMNEIRAGRSETIGLDEVISKYEFQFPALFTFAINTIGTWSERYPVSIGIAGPSNQLWHRLITPEAWRALDCEAGRLMGITQEGLSDHGTSAALLCRELNQVFEGQKLLTNNYAQVAMMHHIFKSSGQNMTFRALHVESVMGQEISQELVNSLVLVDKTYKADENAKILRDAIVLQFS